MAIARNASANLGLQAAVSVYTAAYTCGAGAHRRLFVGFFGNVTAADEVTSVTYAGTAMTRVGTARPDTSDRPVYLYTLLAPASGANNVVITFTGSQDGVQAIAADYTGCGATIGAGVVATNPSSASGVSIAPLSGATTTWAIAAIRDTTGGALTYTAGVSQILAANGLYLADSNAITNAAVSHTITVSNGGHEAIVGVTFTIVPELIGVGGTGSVGFIRVTGGDVTAVAAGDTTTQFELWRRTNTPNGDANTELRRDVVALYSVGQPTDPDLTTYTSKLVERKTT